MFGGASCSHVFCMQALRDDSQEAAKLNVSRRDNLEYEFDIMAQGASASAVTPAAQPEGLSSFQAAGIVILCFLVTVICALDRAAMSVAILPMSSEFGYSEADKGVISSAYFWGYVVSNIFSGVLGTSVSPKLLLGYSVAFWSLFTVLTPASATISLPALIACRALMGLCEGTCLPTMQTVLLNWVPNRERSRALSLVTSGITAGTVGSLFLAPMLVNSLGWESVFYTFGATGFVWLAPWVAVAEDKPKSEEACIPYACEVDDVQFEKANDPTLDWTTIPWGDIFQNTAFLGVIACAVAHNVGSILMLSWLPTYFASTYGLDVTNAAAVSAPPWVCCFIVSNLAGLSADTLMERGVDTGTMRRGLQVFGSLGPALCLLKIASGQVASQEASLWFTAALGLSGCGVVGFAAAAQDMSRKYASVLYGTFNSIGCLAGSIAVWLAGLVLEDNPNSGFEQVFFGAVVVYCLGAAAFLATYRGKQEFA